MFRSVLFSKFSRVIYAILKFILVLLAFHHCIACLKSYHELRLRGKSEVSSTSPAPTEKVRVFCMILTHAINHNYHAVHAKRTWAKHCDRVLFVSDVEHGELEPVVFPQRGSWALVKQGFDYVYQHHFAEADWFLKAHDDSFVVVENLRQLLAPYSNDAPLYFGCKLAKEIAKPYMHGPAGYVLSREALRRFVTEALPNSTLCLQDHHGDEAEEIANCLRNVGVEAGDSRDKNGHSTFMPFSIKEHLRGLSAEKHEWLLNRSYYPVENGTALLSRHAISFPQVQPPAHMYDFNYFFYNLRLFGRADIQDVFAEEEFKPTPDNLRLQTS